MGAAKGVQFEIITGADLFEAGPAVGGLPGRFKGAIAALGECCVELSISMALHQHNFLEDYYFSESCLAFNLTVV